MCGLGRDGGRDGAVDMRRWEVHFGGKPLGCVREFNVRESLNILELRDLIREAVGCQGG